MGKQILLCGKASLFWSAVVCSIDKNITYDHFSRSTSCKFDLSKITTICVAYLPSELSRNEKNLAFRKNVLKKHALKTRTSALLLFPPKYVEETVQGQFNQEAKIKVFQGEGCKQRAKWPVFWSVQIFSLKWIMWCCSSSTYLERTNKQTVNKKNSNLALGRTCMFGKCLPGRMMFPCNKQRVCIWAPVAWKHSYIRSSPSP